MAFLAIGRRLWPVALAGCAATGCADSQALGHAELWLRDCGGPVPCENAPAEHFQVQAFFDAASSRYAPHGFYAYLELQRDDGRLGVLELDVTTTVDGEITADAYQVSYRELEDKQQRFESETVQGDLLLPRELSEPEAPSCTCSAGLFSLQFVDPGDDGRWSTQDDQARELAFGHLSRDGTICSEQLHTNGDAGLRVSLRECSPPVEHDEVDARSPAQPSSSHSRRATSTCAYDCYPSNGGYTAFDVGWGASAYDQGGCGNSGYSDDDPGCGGGSTQGADGCGSDGYAEPDSDYDSGSSNDHAGCGDTGSDDNAASSGCEGDTSESPSSCHVVQARGRRRGRRGSAFFGTGLPLLLVCLWQATRASRARRSRPRAAV